MSERKKADIMLLMVTLFWGASYYMMDISLRDLQPMTLNAVRFLVAFILVFAIFFKKMKNINKETFKYAFLAGGAMGMAYFCCTKGLLYTSISNAGFLGALAVVFTPILGRIFKNQIPEKKFTAVVIMCLIGVGLLTINDGFKPEAGDFLCITGALFFSGNLLLTETAVSKEEVEPLKMAGYELGIIAIIMLVGAFLFETPTLPKSPVTWASTLFLGVFCSGISIVIQVFAQRHTTASHVGIIYTLEPLFAAITAYAFAGEVLSGRGYAGAAIMMSAILFMETDIKNLNFFRKILSWKIAEFKHQE